MDGRSDDGQDRATLVALTAISLALGDDSRTPDDSVAFVIEQTALLLDASVTLWVTTPHGRLVRHGVPDATTGTSGVRVGEGPVGRVARHGVAVLARDEEEPHAHARRVLVPLTGSGGVCGVLDVVADDERREFDVIDLAAAQAVADRLAWSVTSARMVEELRHRADHDELTGLPNRAYLVRHLDEMLSSEGSQDVAVAFVDVDRFKDVNDGLGHAVGDTVLRAVATRLREQVRAEDFVARFGGDEFVVVAQGFADDDELRALLTRLTAPPEIPLRLGSERLYVALSAGLARHTPGDDADTMLRQADAAMYRAKVSGTSRWEEFTGVMAMASLDQLRRETELREGIDAGELFCEYQPILDAASGLVVAHEALVRWDHPRLGRQEPNSFVPAAEVSGLILPLGRWVLDRALRAAAGWAPSVSVSVNVSARQLAERSLPGVVLASLDTHGVDPARLIVEITETTLMRDAELALQSLDALRAEGVQIAIDDFGTGYTSIGQFEQLPIDHMKIDRKFTAATGTPRGHDLFAALVQLAQALGVTTIAEGVETEEQRRIISYLGATCLQGFLVGRPVPLALVGVSQEPAPDASVA